jgi:hypothetical protein
MLGVLLVRECETIAGVKALTPAVVCRSAGSSGTAPWGNKLPRTGWQLLMFVAVHTFRKAPAGSSASPKKARAGAAHQRVGRGLLEVFVAVANEARVPVAWIIVDPDVLTVVVDDAFAVDV